jgi:hypothetical protein
MTTVIWLATTHGRRQRPRLDNGKLHDVAAKFLLLSIVLVLIALPLLTSRDMNARRGLKKALLLMITFNLLYLFLVRFVYPRLQ